jgi:hypothetical protein
MLVMFKVRNYMSFKDTAILDMRATSYVQHPTHCVTINDTKLLKTIAIYGANASGKSNFISAMYTFQQIILSQILKSKDNTIKSETKLEPFMLCDTIDNVSEFEMIFISNGELLDYGFEISVDGEIINEWYYINDKKVFERSNTQIGFGNKYKEYIKDYKKVPSDRLYIAVLEYFLEDNAKKIILSNFVDYFYNQYNVFSEIIFESTIKKFTSSVLINERLLTDTDYKNRVEKYLQKIDVAIKKLDIQKESVINDNGKEVQRLVVKTIHNVYDANNNIIGEKSFNIQQESTGTLRFIAYIQNIINMVDDGGVFIIDELTARLHPLLTKLIVDIIQSSSNTKAQFIFTTHDISILNKSQFRRDEIAFVEKNNQEESSLFTLSDLKVREDASFSKDYLQGKYGAIQVINYDAIFGGGNYE